MTARARAASSSRPGSDRALDEQIGVQQPERGSRGDSRRPRSTRFTAASTSVIASPRAAMRAATYHVRIESGRSAWRDRRRGDRSRRARPAARSRRRSANTSRPPITTPNNTNTATTVGTARCTRKARTASRAQVATSIPATPRTVDRSRSTGTRTVAARRRRPPPTPARPSMDRARATPATATTGPARAGRVQRSPATTPPLVATSMRPLCGAVGNDLGSVALQ